MPLGKGLESLLPPQPRDNGNGNQPASLPDATNEAENIPAQTSPQEKERLPAPVPAPAEDKHSYSADAPLSPGTVSDKILIVPPLNKAAPHEPPVKEAIFQIETEKIAPNPFQPRRDFNEEELKELSRSIQEFGILQPLVVLKLEKETELGTGVSYQLIAGERRLKAAKIAGLHTVPCIIRRTDRDVEQLEMATVENLQRSNLNPIETARAYAKLQDEFKMTQREIASRLGKSREAVANALRLLNLPSDMQEALSKGGINESHGRLLLSVQEDPVLQRTLFNDIMRTSMSVRDLKARIKNTGAAPSQRAQTPIVPDPEEEHIKEGLEEALGTKVKIEKGERGGRVIISFYSKEELESLLSKLKGGGNLSPLPPEFPSA